MKLTKTIASIALGPFILWITGVLELLEGIGLAHPHWSTTAHNLAAALALVLILLTMLYVTKYPQHARPLAFGCAGLFVLAFIACLLLRDATADASSSKAIEAYKAYWRDAYILMALLFVETVWASLAALVLHNDIAALKR